MTLGMQVTLSTVLIFGLAELAFFAFFAFFAFLVDVVITEASTARDGSGVDSL